MNYWMSHFKMFKKLSAPSLITVCFPGNTSEDKSSSVDCKKISLHTQHEKYRKELTPLPCGITPSLSSSLRRSIVLKCEYINHDHRNEYFEER